ncbi:MAG: retroviral-like aspartic protease family protein [Rhodospirillales bacterium]|nr:retroviral-like aspartic protease family protein [Rhodospirillales bacterium]
MTSPRQRGCSGLIAVAVVLLLNAAPAAADGDHSAGGLAAQLRAIGEQERLRFVGLNRLGGAPARAVGDASPLKQRLDQLLAGYNYLVTVDDRGQPATVRILGRRLPVAEPPSPAPVTVSTTRHGRHHLVSAKIIGRNGMATEIMLMLDTGASTVVLPQSLAAPLGFNPHALTDSVARTAAGSIAVRLGQLSEVRVGAAHATDVAVAFVDDATLGDGSLLGMSFLERFDVRLEDANDRLTLFAR